MQKAVEIMSNTINPLKIPEDRTEAARYLDGLVESAAQSFIVMGQALRAMRDGQYYRANDEYKTFKDYLRARGIAPRYAQSIITSSIVAEAMAQLDHHAIPSTERQCRALEPIVKLKTEKKLRGVSTPPMPIGVENTAEVVTFWKKCQAAYESEVREAKAFDKRVPLFSASFITRQLPKRLQPAWQTRLSSNEKGPIVNLGALIREMVEFIHGNKLTNREDILRAARKGKVKPMREVIVSDIEELVEALNGIKDNLD